MTEISLLNKTLTDLRIARLQFMLANGDNESTERLDKNLGIYLAQQTKLLETFKNPVNVAQLKEQAGYNAQYQNSLNDMRKAYAQANASRPIIDQAAGRLIRSEEHTSELQSLMRRSYAIFCLKKKTTNSTPIIK